MENITHWVSIKDAARMSDVSEMTVRRWQKKHINDPEYVKNEKGEINAVNHEKFTLDYPLKNDSKNFNDQENFNNNPQPSNLQDHEKLALMTLSKQSNDISQLLLSKQKVSLLRHSTFWSTTISIIIIIILIVGAYYYKKESVSNNDISYNEKIELIKESNLKEIHSIQVLNDTKILNLENIIDKNIKTHEYLLKEIKESHINLTEYQKKHIDELSKKIEALQIEKINVLKSTSIPLGQGSDSVNSEL